MHDTLNSSIWDTQCAEDVMSTELVTVRPDCTLAELAWILVRNKISGVPVVDHTERLLGMVTKRDLAARARSTLARPRTVSVDFRTTEGDVLDDAEITHRPPAFRNLDESDLRALSRSFVEEDYGQATVADVCTPYTISVGKKTPLSQIAALMVEKKVHRLVIIEDHRPVGIVTGMDLLRTIAVAAEAERRAPHRRPVPPTRRA